MPVRIGTRASTLAVTQSGLVADALRRAGVPDVELVTVRTDGDRLTGALASLGGTGVFVTALRTALVDGRCDVAVHSFKDLPTGDADGVRLAAVPVREDPHDVLCARSGWTLGTLPRGARLGTGSPRRAAQVLAVRRDLRIVELRGNVDTRLRRVAPGDLDAVLLARAGLARLGRLDAVTEELASSVVLPAPGQGALAVEVAVGRTDPVLAEALAVLDDAPTRVTVCAERALLARLGAGCAAPVGGSARLVDGRLTLDSVVAAPDGSALLRRSGSVMLGVATARRPTRADGTDPSTGAGRPGAAAGAGVARAEQLAARLGTQVAEDLLDAGAGELAGLAAR